MGTISSSAFVSLDGVVNHLDTWHFDYVDEELDALALEQLRAADAMIMGRKTYEVYAGGVAQSRRRVRRCHQRRPQARRLHDPF